jgi:hypothetical protein
MRGIPTTNTEQHILHYATPDTKYATLKLNASHFDP